MLHEWFPDFYEAIKSRTVTLIVLLSTSFLIRAAFNFLLIVYFDEPFQKWIEISVEHNTWTASIYLVGHSVGENLPLAAILLSLNFAVNEKVRAIRLAEETSEALDSRLRSGTECFDWTDYRRQLETYLEETFRMI